MAVGRDPVPALMRPEYAASMNRSWIWLQLVIGWLPVWALFSLMIYVAHGGHLGEAMLVSLRMMVLAALLGVLVHRLSGSVPWPYPFQLRFVAIHIAAAGLFAALWFLLNTLVESLLHWRWVSSLGPGLLPYLITGVWLYVMIAGVAYATRAAERRAELKALEARSQLAALRAQLQPHFLFNALHTVVQLIPSDPRAATRAAEQLADALRCVVQEQRDQLPLADEWAFVQRYLAIEAIRYGDRLQLSTDIAPEALEAELPSFALQTLVENALRHAVAPRVETTTLCVSAKMSGGRLQLTVSDDGPGASEEQLKRGVGTGLQRLRERLHWLYGGSASLRLERAEGGGLQATLNIDQNAAASAPERLDDA